MTNRQISILRKIHKYKNLNKIIQKTKTDDYLELQQSISTTPLKYIEFSDTNMDNDTEVRLTAASIELLEKRNRDMFWRILSAVIAIAAIAATIYTNR